MILHLHQLVTLVALACLLDRFATVTGDQSIALAGRTLRTGVSDEDRMINLSGLDQTAKLVKPGR
ncbi:hypothetical protein PI124_g6658 [Phytophthora idaei]|nr:hypothetical protein PI125_g7974 [Phytophthora idaei]KAG3156875.1 hypothetical protein PI126_g8572 [Phytophthora idaei]KAG3248676.1 hypothetical protein PI124_g6658 [Phytophthora idaei]